MKFFVDSADVAEIEDLAARGLVDGVTTNPSLVAAEGRDFIEVLGQICGIVPGPVSAEVTSVESAGMAAEGRRLASVAENVVVKVPLTLEGLDACRVLSGEGHRVNVTLCFSAVQAMLAARSGATFVSPFVGRLDDAGHDGMELIGDIRAIYDTYPSYGTEILAASVRHVDHVKRAALLGADAVTVPPKVLRSLVQHPLTDKGLAAFLADWKATGQKIL